MEFSVQQINSSGRSRRELSKPCQHSLRATEKQIDYSGYLYPAPPYPPFSILIQFDVYIRRRQIKKQVYKIAA